MPENDLIRRSLDLGLAVTQLTRQRAEKLVHDLVRTGEVNRDQATARVEELLERSRQSSEALLAMVRKEIDERVAQLNLVTLDDLSALASRIGINLPAAKQAVKKAPAKAKTATKTAAKQAVKQAPAKAKTATKTAAKKAAKQAPAKKAAAKKAPATKAVATKAVATKAAATKAAPTTAAPTSSPGTPSSSSTS